METNEEVNALHLTKEERRERWGRVCDYCGFREASHPVGHAAPEKDGLLCEVPRLDGEAQEGPQ